MINLPWPPKELSPNARVFWAKKSKIAKKYRLDCKLLSVNKITLPESEKLHLWITFYPPDKRKRDDDNLIASFKSGRDGVADALKVDDSRFITHPFVSDCVVKGGCVSIKITSGE